MVAPILYCFFHELYYNEAMRDYAQLIHASMEWAATVSFRPFKVKKWLIMGFAAFMAGYITTNSRLNLDLPSDFLKGKKTQAVSTQQTPAVDATQGISAAATTAPGQPAQKTEKEKVNPALIILIVTAVVCLILCLAVLLLWLYSRFSFVFLDNVAGNDASIKLPFVKYKAQGNSFFCFNIAMSGINIFTFGVLALIAFLYFSQPAITHNPNGPPILNIIVTGIFFGLLFLSLLIISAAISILTRDFVLVAMFKDNINVMPAWEKIFAFVNQHKQDIIVYIFIKIGVSILALLIYMVLCMAALFGMALVLIPAGLALTFIYGILSGALKIFYVIILILALVPAGAFLLYCFICSYLPFAVFLRTFSIKFLSSMDPHYNLFKKETAL
ncbi:MAG: hypothetical protein Q8O22_08095 [Candidatus Omnitrophota bacterium]|nr:hypothetical protein [Candidatus Omnitrophota bacterium]